MEFIEQHPKDLRLIVVAADAQLDRLNVIHEQCVVHAAGRSTVLRVIGESHWVTVHAGEQRLHEVLACYTPANVPAAAIKHLPEQAPLEFAAPGYRTRVWLAPMSAAIAALGRSHPNLAVHFPRARTDGWQPLTRIWWDTASQAAFVWRSVHVYALAEGDIAVLSESCIAWAYFEASGLYHSRSEERLCSPGS